MSLFVFGMGYSGREAARAMASAERGLAVAGTARTPEGADAIAALGFAGHVFTGAQKSGTLAPDLARASRVLSTIAPDAEGDPVLAWHGDDLASGPGLVWACYYSTIGVYGDAGGAWVDEASPLRPSNARTLRRVAAEDAWRRCADRRGIPLLVLRLGGIYGPGRSPFDKLARGEARRIIKPGQVFNRIHVADIARVTALAAQQRLAGTFNLCDDEPAPPQDVIAHAAELLGVAPPPEIGFDEAELSPMARAFYADNKRVSNAAIKRALGIELVYPNYRASLAALRPE